MCSLAVTNWLLEALRFRFRNFALGSMAMPKTKLITFRVPFADDFEFRFSQGRISMAKMPPWPSAAYQLGSNPITNEKHPKPVNYHHENNFVYFGPPWHTLQNPWHEHQVFPRTCPLPESLTCAAWSHRLCISSTCQPWPGNKEFPWQATCMLESPWNM